MFNVGFNGNFAGMDGTSNHVIRPSGQRGTRNLREEYDSTPLCDPNVDPNCPQSGGVVVYAMDTHRFQPRDRSGRKPVYDGGVRFPVGPNSALFYGPGSR